MFSNIEELEIKIVIIEYEPMYTHLQWGVLLY